MAKFRNFARLIRVLARIMALDIGEKRTGIAVTDPLQMIATGLEGVETSTLFNYLDDYLTSEKVEKIVVGKPVQMDNTPSESADFIEKMVEKLSNRYNEVGFEYFDERFTSKIAFQSMKTAGASKKQMKNKQTVDKVSATVILQGYLEQVNTQKL